MAFFSHIRYFTNLIKGCRTIENEVEYFASLLMVPSRPDCILKSPGTALCRSALSFAPKSKVIIFF